MEAFTAFYHALDVGRGKRLEWVLREVRGAKGQGRQAVPYMSLSIRA